MALKTARKTLNADHLLIDGELVLPAAKRQHTLINPATGAAADAVPEAGTKDVERAVAAAKAAFADGRWSRIGPSARAAALYKLADLLEQHLAGLAVIESRNTGKPIKLARDSDLPFTVDNLRFFAGAARSLEGRATSEYVPGYTSLLRREPVGVIAQLCPWNYPLMMAIWKIGPALAAGNTVVLKPAEETPLTALALGHLAIEAGLPAGVLNIVTGGDEVGAALVAHPDVRMISLTGASETGAIIMREAAATLKRVHMELGGKAPFVVFDDADLDSVVEGVVDAIWFNQGQVCCAGSRLLVQETVADTLLGKLRARMEKLRVGDPLDKAVDIGAIIAPVQLEKIQRLVAQGVAEGARCWQPSWSCPTDGYFYPPTLFTEVAPSSTIAQVEIFGPVLVSMTFRTPAEAVALANNTAYGLAASVWSENVNLALDVARKIAAGTLWINSTNLFDAASGFGGYRESGFGREGGREGLSEYLQSAWEAAGGDSASPLLTREGPGVRSPSHR